MPRITRRCLTANSVPLAAPGSSPGEGPGGGSPRTSPPTLLGSGAGEQHMLPVPNAAPETEVRKASWRVYKDPDNPLANNSSWRAFVSAFVTFNLAIMGGSVLPMPYAISKTGVLVGLLTMVVVAAVNDYTTCLTISAAYTTGLDSFEALALWAGGPRWKLFTQVILISLLWAPNSGGLSLMGDVAQVMVQQVQAIAAGSSPVGAAAAADLAAVALAQGSLVSGPGSWATAGKSWVLARLADGQSLMVLMTLLVVMPLSCQKHMRSLESAAGLGLLVILGLLAVLAVGALQAGLPAIADGQLPLWSIKVNDQLPEAFALLGYAFYLQPLIMPIIREMPEGRAGRQALTAAVHSSLLGSSLLLYAGVGIFGAALFGHATESNIMLNALSSNPWVGLMLNGCMLFYLAAGAAACQYPLRTSIDVLLVGEHVPMTRPRAVVINAVTLGVSLCVALVTPGGAAKVYSIVGATGVCIMCYVLPVIVHYKILRHRQLATQQWQRQKEQQFLALAVDPTTSGGVSDAVDASSSALAAPLLVRHSSASSLTSPDVLVIPTSPTGALLPTVMAPALLQPLLCWPACPPWLDLAVRMLLPAVVLCVGVGFSVAALHVAVQNWQEGP